MSHPVRLYARAETPVTTELLRELAPGAEVRPSRHAPRRDRVFTAGWADLEVRVNILRGAALAAHVRALHDALPAHDALRPLLPATTQLVELTLDPVGDARTAALVAALAQRLDATVVDPLPAPRAAAA